MDAARIRLLEEIGFDGVPAATTVLDGGLVTRITPGSPHRRQNSTTCLDPGDVADLDRRFDRAMRLLVRNGTAPVLRETPLTPPGLVARLDAGGFAREGETEVLVLDRVDTVAGADPAIAPIEDPDAFAELHGRFTGRPPAAIARKAATIRAVAVDRLTLVAAGPDGRPVGAALVTVSRGHAGLFEIAVDPAARGRGIGRRLVAAGLHAARPLGASQAFLQVEAANAPARALYRSLGFAPVYSYRYRRPAGDPPGGAR